MRFGHRAERRHRYGSATRLNGGVDAGWPAAASPHDDASHGARKKKQTTPTGRVACVTQCQLRKVSKRDGALSRLSRGFRLPLTFVLLSQGKEQAPFQRIQRYSALTLPTDRDTSRPCGMWRRVTSPVDCRPSSGWVPGTGHGLRGGCRREDRAPSPAASIHFGSPRTYLGVTTSPHWEARVLRNSWVQSAGSLGSRRAEAVTRQAREPDHRQALVARHGEPPIAPRGRGGGNPRCSTRCTGTLAWRRFQPRPGGSGPLRRPTPVRPHLLSRCVPARTRVTVDSPEEGIADHSCCPTFLQLKFSALEMPPPPGAKLAAGGGG